MNMLNCSFQFFRHADFALTLVAFGILADLFWPYFTGIALLAIGLIKIIKDELPQKRGLDKIMPFGRFLCHTDGSIPHGPHGRCGADRTPGSILDAGATILDLSGGHWSDCRSAEHHPKEIFKVGGHTSGEHASTLRGFDAHPQHRGDTRRSFVLGNRSAGHRFQRRRLCVGRKPVEKNAFGRRARAGNSRALFRGDTSDAAPEVAVRTSRPRLLSTSSMEFLSGIA
jgi:hypothetical protein